MHLKKIPLWCYFWMVKPIISNVTIALGMHLQLYSEFNTNIVFRLVFVLISPSVFQRQWRLNKFYLSCMWCTNIGSFIKLFKFNENENCNYGYVWFTFSKLYNYSCSIVLKHTLFVMIRCRIHVWESFFMLSVYRKIIFIWQHRNTICFLYYQMFTDLATPDAIFN